MNCLMVKSSIRFGKQSADQTLEERLQLHQAAQFTGVQSPGTGSEAVLLACFRSAPTGEQNSHENNRTLSRVTGVIRGGGAVSRKVVELGTRYRAG